MRLFHHSLKSRHYGVVSVLPHLPPKDFLCINSAAPHMNLESWRVISSCCQTFLLAATFLVNPNPKEPTFLGLFILISLDKPLKR